MTQASEVHGVFGAAVAQAFETKMEALSGSPAQAKPERQRYRWKRDLDQALREGYRAGRDSKQRAIDQICLITGWPRQACWGRARALDLTEGLGARPRKHLAEVGGLFERSDFRSGFLANPVLHLLLASIPRSQHGLVSDWRGS